MAKPNLALIPATIGDKVYSILPSDGVGDFDFTRASTATRINAQGLIEEVASGENRLNYSLLDGEVVGCPHLLLEPSRTNLETKSNGFSTWGTNSNITRTANYIISPDGTLNGTRLQFTANGFCANTTQSLATYTMSCYAKRNDSGSQNVGFFTNGSGAVNSAWEITSEWKRFSYTFPALNASFMGIAGESGADISVFGFQIEGLVSYASSYIKTNGSSVTRAAETCNGSGDAATFNDSEGVLMAEFSALSQSPDWGTISITNGVDLTHWIAMFISGSQDNTLRFDVRANSSYQMQYTFNVNSIDTFNKFSILYKENDLQVWSNGFKLNQVNVASVPYEGGLVELAFDRPSGSSDPFYGKTKQIQYFDSVLDSAQLEELTSWDSFRAMAEGQLYTIE